MRVRDDSYLNLNLYCSNNVVECLHLQVDGIASGFFRPYGCAWRGRTARACSTDFGRRLSSALPGDAPASRGPRPAPSASLVTRGDHRMGDKDRSPQEERTKAMSQLGRSPFTSSEGSTSSAAATRTSVSKVGEPFPSSRCEMYVRWTPASSASASWLTGGSSLSRYSRRRFPNSSASASLDVERAPRVLAIQAIRVGPLMSVYRKLPGSLR